MCEWGTHTVIHVIRRNNPYVPDGWHPMGVDACIAAYVQKMNVQGIITVGCCCGHGKDVAVVLIEPESMPLLRLHGYEFEWYEDRALLHRIPDEGRVNVDEEVTHDLDKLHQATKEAWLVANQKNDVQSLWTYAFAASREIRELRSALERAHRPQSDTYACQRCGRRDGLDTVVTNEHWATITEGTLPPGGVEVIDGKWNLLCLWCIDELCAQHGIETRATLHFAGKAVSGGSRSDSDYEFISQFVAQRDAAERMLCQMMKLAGVERYAGDPEWLAERIEHGVILKRKECVGE